MMATLAARAKKARIPKSPPSAAPVWCVEGLAFETFERVLPEVKPLKLVLTPLEVPLVEVVALCKDVDALVSGSKEGEEAC